MIKSSELVAKVVDIAKHYKTLYVMGCFGAPLTDTNKSRYIKNHPYNMAAARTSMIMAATPDTFGFDCVNLIKAVLWGWTGDKTKSYGGAKYATNGVPDEGADTMIKRCKDATASGWDNDDPGEVVSTTGHIGLYIRNGYSKFRLYYLSDDRPSLLLHSSRLHLKLRNSAVVSCPLATYSRLPL